MGTTSASVSLIPTSVLSSSLLGAPPSGGGPRPSGDLGKSLFSSSAGSSLFGEVSIVSLHPCPPIVPTTPSIPPVIKTKNVVRGSGAPPSLPIAHSFPAYITCKIRPKQIVNPNLTTKFCDLFPEQKFDCYLSILPWVKLVNEEASTVLHAMLPISGAVIAKDLALLLSYVTFVYDLKSVSLPRLSKSVICGYNFLHFDVGRMVPMLDIIAILANFDGFVGGGAVVDPLDMINVAAAVGATTIAANEASGVFRTTLDALLPVSTILSAEDQANIRRERPDVRFVAKLSVSNDHPLLAACREIIRSDHERRAKIKTTTARTLVLGATEREFGMYGNNRMIYFQIANREGKDTERLVMSMLNHVRKTKTAKVTNKKLQEIGAIERATNDVKTIHEMMVDWQTSKKLPERFILWEESQALIEDGVVYNYTDDLDELAARRMGGCSKLLSKVSRVAERFAPVYKAESMNKATFDQLVFEDVGYNFTFFDWYLIFKNTGAMVAYGYMCLPWQLAFPNLSAPTGYYYKREGSKAYLAYPGFSNGYCHSFDAWSTILNSPVINHKGISIGIEIMSRAGPMASVKLYRSTHAEIVTRVIALPKYLMSVQLLHISKCMTPAGFVRNTLDFKYFSVRRDEFYDALNYSLDIAPESLSFRSVLLFIRRKHSGMSLVSKDLSKTWTCDKVLIPEFALVVFLYAVYVQNKFKNFESDVKTRGIRKILQRAMKCFAFAKGAYDQFRDLFSSSSFLEILVRDTKNEFWQTRATRPSKSPVYVYVGEDPEYCLDETINVDENDPEEESDCAFCEDLKLAVGSQKFYCDRSVPEIYMHEFALTSSELTALRGKLAENNTDPIGLKTTKENALKKVPVAAFSHRVRVRYICGPPGTGKSHAIRGMAGSNDIVVAPFSRLKNDYTNFYHELKGVKTSIPFYTQHTGLDAMNHPRVFVDEYTAMPYECLAIILFNCDASEVVFVGDHRQTALINEIEGMSIPSKVDFSRIRTHELIKNYRNPSDCVCLLNTLYGYNMEATNSRRGYKFGPTSDFEKYRYTHTPLFFRHHTAARFGVAGDTGEKVTVRANQGATFEKVALVVANDDQNLFNMSSMAIVALSRHKKECVVLHEDAVAAVFAGKLSSTIPPDDDDGNNGDGKIDPKDDTDVHLSGLNIDDEGVVLGSDKEPKVQTRSRRASRQTVIVNNQIKRPTTKDKNDSMKTSEGLLGMSTKRCKGIVKASIGQCRNVVGSLSQVQEVIKNVGVDLANRVSDINLLADIETDVSGESSTHSSIPPLSDSEKDSTKFSDVDEQFLEDQDTQIPLEDTTQTTSHIPKQQLFSEDTTTTSPPTITGQPGQDGSGRVVVGGLEPPKNVEKNTQSELRVTEAPRWGDYEGFYTDQYGQPWVPESSHRGHLESVKKEDSTQTWSYIDEENDQGMNTPDMSKWELISVGSDSGSEPQERNHCLIRAFSDATGIPLKTVYKKFKKVIGANRMKKMQDEGGLSTLDLENFCNVCGFRVRLYHRTMHLFYTIGNEGAIIASIDYEGDGVEGHFSRAPMVSASPPIRQPKIDLKKKSKSIDGGSDRKDKSERDQQNRQIPALKLVPVEFPMFASALADVSKTDEDEPVLVVPTTGPQAVISNEKCVDERLLQNLVDMQPVTLEVVESIAPPTDSTVISVTRLPTEVAEFTNVEGVPVEPIAFKRTSTTSLKNSGSRSKSVTGSTSSSSNATSYEIFDNIKNMKEEKRGAGLRAKNIIAPEVGPKYPDLLWPSPTIGKYKTRSAKTYSSDSQRQIAHRKAIDIVSAPGILGTAPTVQNVDSHSNASEDKESQTTDTVIIRPYSAAGVQLGSGIKPSDVFPLNVSYSEIIRWLDENNADSAPVHLDLIREQILSMFRRIDLLVDVQNDLCLIEETLRRCQSNPPNTFSLLIRNMAAKFWVKRYRRYENAGCRPKTVGRFPRFEDDPDDDVMWSSGPGKLMRPAQGSSSYLLSSTSKHSSVVHQSGEYRTQHGEIVAHQEPHKNDFSGSMSSLSTHLSERSPEAFIHVGDNPLYRQVPSKKEEHDKPKLICQSPELEDTMPTLSEFVRSRKRTRSGRSGKTSVGSESIREIQEVIEKYRESYNYSGKGIFMQDLEQSRQQKIAAFKHRYKRHVPDLIGGAETVVTPLPQIDIVEPRKVPPQPLSDADQSFLEMARLFTDPIVVTEYLAEMFDEEPDEYRALEQTSFDCFQMLLEDFATMDEDDLPLTNQETLAYVDDKFGTGVYDMTRDDQLNPRGHLRRNKEHAWSLLAVAPGVKYFKMNDLQAFHCLQSRYLTKAMSVVFNTESERKAREIADLFFDEHMGITLDVFNEQDVWMTTMESEHSMKIKNYEKQVKFDIDGDIDVRFTMKDIFKPFKTKIDLFKAGQGISAWAKDTQTVFQTAFRLINKHFINCLKPHVIYDNGVDENVLMKRVNALLSCLPSVCVNGVIDATACDSGQNRFTQAIERRVLERMGVSDDFLDWYYLYREEYTLKGYGVVAEIKGIKTSGEPATLLNNTILMAALMNYLVRGEGPCVLVIKGDDGLKRQANMKYNQKLKDSMKRYLKMDFKVDIDVPITFCGYFLSGSVLVPDLVRKVFKVLGHHFRDYEHFREYQQSLRDWILNVNKLGVNDVCYIAALSYDLEFEHASGLFEGLVSLSHISKRQFEGLFQYREFDWSQPMDTSDKWVQKCTWYKGPN